MAKKLILVFEELEAKKQSQIKSWFKDYLTNPEQSYQSLSQEINTLTGWNVNRRAVSRLREQLGYPERDKEMIGKSRGESIKSTKGSKTTEVIKSITTKMLESHTKEEIEEKYRNSSMSEMSREFGTYNHYMRMALESLNIPIKELPYSYHDLIADLEGKGYRKQEIEELYLDRESTMNDFIFKISEIVDRPLTYKHCLHMVRSLEITQPPEIIAYRQGRKSRKEFVETMDRLKKAGFLSREEVAEYYEVNKSLTKQGLVKYLNGFLDDNDQRFTVRWTERHVDPFLSEDRLIGVSRVELSLLEYIESIDGISGHEIICNSRQVISPYELDIYIPSLNVAIELNGNYWHSDRFLLENHNMTSKEYHTMKQLLCKEKGIDLLFVWEFDWEGEEQQQVKTALDHYFKTREIDSILSKLEYV